MNLRQWLDAQKEHWSNTTSLQKSSMKFLCTAITEVDTMSIGQDSIFVHLLWPVDFSGSLISHGSTFPPCLYSSSNYSSSMHFLTLAVLTGVLTFPTKRKRAWKHFSVPLQILLKRSTLKFFMAVHYHPDFFPFSPPRGFFSYFGKFLRISGNSQGEKAI